MVTVLRCIPFSNLSRVRLGVDLVVRISLLWFSFALSASAQTTSNSALPSASTTDGLQGSFAKGIGQGQDIGNVSFLIGKATLLRQGVSMAVTQSSTLQVGDDLVTQDNGHIHVRFVDGAMVSLRPSSLLKIKAYRFDPQNPSNSEVRFELEQGVVRAISGQAAESAKDKFRLNTPLAAIGVKGTDFVVEATKSRVNAIVNQGAIVLAPFDAQCKASSTGPCATAFAKELTAALKGMALTYSMSMPSPQLLPMGQLKGSELLNLLPPMGGVISQSTGGFASANNSNSNANNNSEGLTGNPGGSSVSSTGSSTVNSTGSSTSTAGTVTSVGSANTAPVNATTNASTSASTNVPGAAASSGFSSANANNANTSNNRVQQTQVDGQVYSTANQILNRTVSDTSLVWGRWGAPNPQDNLTIVFKDAMQNRAVTIGDGYFFLFRQENNVPNLLSLQQGNVNFALQSSYAYFLDLGNNVSQATVNSGTLGVNFSTLDVKTTLNLTAQTPSSAVLSSTSGAATSLNQTLTATAKLNPSSGIFLLSPVATPAVSLAPYPPLSATTSVASPTVAGAVSLDSKQAGYLFTLPTVSGAFKGATLWGR